jgi:hypothetical protein
MLADQAVTVILDAPAPCDRCRHRVHCAQSGEACLSFDLYLKGKSEGKWRLMPTQPRADLGARLGLRQPDAA